ncbi:hypothetical protein H4W23_23160 [Streptomyces gardneri]|uniref:hypothetical protein n=1 Tax=Streptomyces gardneri TaxID=66892 RepID=UPI0006BDB54E|nr:hypothetical protein [Streptomyces gardneri]QPK47235.1 hypothetical protein H4W23_23160 [Streptomyces gardneri]WRK38658.1 hypothetical protein U0M97_23260 [Streptomyces venezuelae]CUM39335.1 hypothetical protein BN2537_7635 [Streptomyces venezuelae]
MSPIRRTVRTSTRAFLALPGSLAAVALTLTGRPDRAARVRERLAGAAVADTAAGGWTPGRVLGRAVLGLPLDAAAFVLVGYALFNSVRNLGYPIWYLDTDYRQAWGGPTMAGVWAVHAFGWLLCLAVLLHWPVRWLARGQAALDRRLS